MLNSIRNNRAFNWLIRTIIKKIGHNNKAFSTRWRISGIVNLTLMGSEFKMFSKCDDGIVNQLYYEDEYVEKDDIKVFLSLAGNDQVIFDIGANTGLYSLAVKGLHPYAKVYAFEPHPMNLERLEYNARINEFKDLGIVAMAVGDQKKKIEFTVPQNGSISDTSSAIDEFSRNSYRGEIKWKRIEVFQTTLDDHVSENKIDRLDMIKIDVEGYELNVLEGAKKVIERFRPKILIESFLDEKKRNYLNALISKFEYDVFFIHKKGIIKAKSSITDFPGLNFLLIYRSGYNDFTPIEALSD